ncbi:MAG: hypothetical protein IKJ36_00510 [Clostridia bacterium]|nr:hypothetical protein [Clostridia bacterium]
MTREQLLLTENVLIDAIKAFHDLDDKKTRETYVREYTLKFCKDNNIDPREAIDVLNAYFERRRKDDTMFNFEHYKGKKTLEKIIFSDELSDDQIKLVENDLIYAIRAFHEISDPKARTEAIREYTTNFCSNNGIKPNQVLPIVKKFFAAQAKTNKICKYEHYQGKGVLESMMLDDNDDDAR